MSNMNSFCEHTIVIPQLPCLFRMAKSDSLTIELVNSVTSDSVISFNYAIRAFASCHISLSLSHDVMDGAELGDKRYI